MSWNRAAERIFGYSAEEAIGRPVAILIPQERHSEEEAILERIRRGERIDHFETVRIRKDGSPVDISLTISPIRNAQGRITGASKIARDISERKQNEAKIELLAREAEHRTRNLLATVQATVNLTRSDTAEGLREAIRGARPGAGERPPPVWRISLDRGRAAQNCRGGACPLPQSPGWARTYRWPQSDAATGCRPGDCGCLARAGDQRGKVRCAVGTRWACSSRLVARPGRAARPSVDRDGRAPRRAAHAKRLRNARR